MIRLAIYFLIFFGVAFLVWRGFRREGEPDAPVDFVGNVMADLRVCARFLGRMVPYIILAGLCVAAYFFFQEVNW